MIDMARCFYRSSYDQSKSTIYMFGDSYLQQIVPAFEMLAKKYNLNIIASPGCPPFGLDLIKVTKIQCSA